MKKVFVVLGLLSASCAMAQPASESLQNAHKAFVAGHMKAMVQHITTVLQSGDGPESKNALKLMNKALEVNNGNLDADFPLPEEIEGMRVFVSRRSSEYDDTYRVGMKISSKVQIGVTQMKLVRYPDTVVADKQAKIGKWEENYDEKYKEYSFKVSGVKQNDPIQEGLYFIQLELTNGKKADGYVILTDMNASTLPELQSPYVGEVYKTAVPTFKFKNYFSPEYKPNERRNLSLGIGQDLTEWKDVWEIWVPIPTLEQTTVCAKPSEGEVSTECNHLEDGKYSLYLNYQERRRYSNKIQLSREASISRAFSVKAN
jgi:hypothetical protein